MIDLSDVTFMIPVKIDSDDRVTNLNIVAMYLRTHFTTNITIAEQADAAVIPSVLCKTLYNTYIQYKTTSYFFHKTRLINAMIKNAKTGIVVMHDSDILCKPDQYVSAVNMLRNRSYEFVYPYNGRVINIARNLVPYVMETLEFTNLADKPTNSKDLALGGCVIYNRERFIQAGMMNEHFVSYGPEDGEQDMRLKKLGLRNTRISEPLYHLDHIRTDNSTEHHPHSSVNWQEFRKISHMSRDQLIHYVNTWGWLK